MRIRVRLITIFFIAFVTLAGFSWFMIRGNENSVKTNFWVNHSQDAIRDIANYYSTCVGLETETRSYVLGGNAKSGLNRSVWGDSLKSQLATLTALTRDNPVQQKNLLLLGQVSNRLVRFTTVLLQSRKGSLQINTLLDESFRGRSLMDSIFRLCNTIRKQEGRILAVRIAQNRKANRQLVIIAIIGSIISFIFLIVGLFQLSKDFSLREKAEQEAKTNEAKYRTLIEDSGVVMFTTAITGNFTFLSNKVASLTGYTREELLGKHYSILVAPDWLEEVTKSYRVQVMTKTHESLMEFPILTKSGERKWVEQMAVILSEGERTTGFQCIVKDISEKKRIELELRESEFKRKENQYRLQAIMDNTTSLVFIKDLDGKYVLVNLKFLEILGQTEEFLYGKTDFDFSSRLAAEKYKRVDEMVIRTLQPQEVVEDLQLKDGVHYFLITKFPLLDNKRRIFGICGIATDISQRKKYEEELILAKSIAEDAEKLQEQFLANMSHEIRTPLNGIIGMTNLLTSTQLHGDQNEFVTTIRESSTNLLVLINDILDFSKIKAGKLTIEQILFDPEEVMARTLNTFRLKIEERGLRLENFFDPNIPRSLTGDPYRLNQILVNLIGNAIKFTEAGEIRVEAKLHKFTMDTVFVEFEVRDTGIGIPEDKWATIFESFAQGSSDTTRKYGGTGLGLAITKKLIDLQDGEIEMQSKVNEGTVFKCTIPYHFTNQNVENAEPKTEDAYLRDMKDINILVAEDNLINQKVVYYTLQRVGAHVDIASNGKEALQKLQTGKKYDLVLMDIQMPEMDGYETTRQIRTILHRNMPIIAMTATVLRGEKEKCLEVGMNDYISKPFAPLDLFRKIGTHLTGKQEPPEPPRQIPDENGPPFRLDYLTELGDNQQMLEILEIFLQMTPIALDEILKAAEGKLWDVVFQKAHRLKTSLGMIQLHSMVQRMDTVEDHARRRQNLEEIPGLLKECAFTYESVRGALEEEREKLGQKILLG